MTSMLSPAEVGAVSIALSISVMFNLTLVNPVWMYILRKLHEWRDSGVLESIILQGFSRYLLLVSILSPALLLGAQKSGWLNQADISKAYLAISFHFAAFSAVSTLPLLLNNLGQISVAAIMNGGIAVASLLGAIIMVKVLGANMTAWLLGLACGYVLVLFLGAQVFWKSLRNPRGLRPGGPDFKNEMLESLWFALPLAVSVLFSWGQQYGYRFVFINELGPSRLGLFFSGYAIGAAVVNTVESVLIQYLQPAFYKRVSRNSPSESAMAWEEYSSKVLPAFLLCVVFAYGAAPYLSKLLLGEKFQAAGVFAVWGAAVEALRAAFAVFSLSAHAQTKTRSLITANATAAIAALVLTSYLIPHLGETGVGVSLVSSFLLAIVIAYAKLGRGMSMPVKISTVRDTIIAAGSIALAFIVIRMILPVNPSTIVAINGLLLSGGIFAISIAISAKLLPVAAWRMPWR